MQKIRKLSQKPRRRATPRKDAESRRKIFQQGKREATRSRTETRGTGKRAVSRGKVPKDAERHEKTPRDAERRRLTRKDAHRREKEAGGAERRRETRMHAKRRGSTPRDAERRSNAEKLGDTRKDAKDAERRPETWTDAMRREKTPKEAARRTVTQQDAERRIQRRFPFPCRVGWRGEGRIASDPSVGIPQNSCLFDSFSRFVLIAVLNVFKQCWSQKPSKHEVKMPPKLDRKTNENN